MKKDNIARSKRNQARIGSPAPAGTEAVGPDDPSAAAAVEARAAAPARR